MFELGAADAAPVFYLIGKFFQKIKTFREDAHAEAEEDVTLRRFGGAEYAFARIPFYLRIST